MLKRKSSKQNSNELILQHFILVIVIFFEALVKVLNLIIPTPKIRSISTNINSKSDSTTDPKNIKSSIKIISKKNKVELKRILKDIDILFNLDKQQLTQLILSNPEAVNLLTIESRKEDLQRMTNLELRSLLKGVKGISNLKKSKLIDIVLEHEIDKQNKGKITSGKEP